MHRIALCLLAVSLLSDGGPSASSTGSCRAADDRAGTISAGDLEFFEKEVRPILANRCYECHSSHSKPPKGGLRLDSRESLLQGGDTGPAIDLVDLDKSLLLDAINYGELYQMPPKSRLPAAEITVLTRWVRLSAPWPQQPSATTTLPGGFDLEARKNRHWCWQPVGQFTPPEVQHADWPIQELDRFILSGLEANGLSPADPAERSVLLRRLYFDLIGLPPTPEQVESFVSHPSPQEWERVVDELLDSRHFGERWARHWMDLVRYAETCGHEFDYPIHDAWRYRDYLIRAFNADVPYDWVVKEHIAGDLLANPRVDPQTGLNESICATGFWWLHEAIHAPVDVRADAALRIDNQIDVFSKTFLGLTVSCARCHDHKFDAIATKDYYALAGIVRSTRRQQALLDPTHRIRELAVQARQCRDEFQQSTARAVHRSIPNVGDTSFARHLLAVREVLHGQPQLSDEAPANGHARPVAAVARQFEMTPARLAAWVGKLTDPAVRSPEHPLALWWDGALARREQPLAQEWPTLRRRWRDAASQRITAAADYQVIGDFNGPTYHDWFVTGEAFGDRPAQAGQWNHGCQSLRILESGTAHSGQLSPQFQGVLRSPTFTISAPNIYYRLAGRDCEVRLIIDGYTMIEFHQLLFGGCKFPINTNDNWSWHRQAGDLQMYLGHRAYIEVIDHGDGWCALDTVCISEREVPPAAAPPDRAEAADAIAADDTVNSVEALADRFGTWWRDALLRWQSNAQTSSDIALINWGLELGLIQGPAADPANQSSSSDPITAWQTEVNRRIDMLVRDLPAPVRVTAAAEGTGENERVFVRGNPRVLGDEVPRQFLSALVGTQPVERGSGRLALAEQVASPANPLTARVAVNRVWYHVFGAGLVPPLDNFGVLGEPPTHPELLDFLAQQFIADGWSIKRLIRKLVLSRTYQMSSRPQLAGDRIDPTNQWWHRAHVRRLEGEVLRDAILVVSGSLDPKLFGPAIPVHITPFMQGRGKPDASGPVDGGGRRSIYAEVRRNFLSPWMLAFDTPVPFSTVGRRNASNVPAQALILMNDPLVVQQARAWSERLLAVADLDFNARVRRAYVQAIARPPTVEEQAMVDDFFVTEGSEYGIEATAARHDPRAWSDFCHVLFNVKEFTFLH